jgi:microcystin-dependent protein
MATGYIPAIGPIQLLTNAGAVASGYKLNTYAAGTSTPQTTYSDSGLSVPNANPIVLDSAGRFVMYFPTNTAYKLVFTDASNNVIWTQDNVSLISVATPPAPAAVPTGAVLWWAAGGSAPSGYLTCDGTAVSRVVYAALFAAISTTWGTGDGSTTFNLPDLRQRFPMGQAASGTGSTLGGTGGAIDHVHASAAHTHTFSASGTTSVESADTSGIQSGSGVTSPATNHTHTITLSGTTGSTTPGPTGNNNPPFAAAPWIIKT